MKNKFFIIAILFLFNNIAFSQFTKGGNKKNYEQYHLTYDTIVTTTKIPISFEKYQFKYFTIGYAIGNGTAKSLPVNYWLDQQNTYNTFTPFEDGKIGLKNGFYLSTGGFKGVDAVNKNLIPELDFGIEQNFDFYYAKSDWSPLLSKSPYTAGTIGEEFYDNILTNKMAQHIKLGYGLGFGISYHTPIENLNVRLSYLFNISIITTIVPDIYYDGSFVSGTDTYNFEYTGTFNDSYPIVALKPTSQIKFGIEYDPLYLGFSINLQHGFIEREVYRYETEYINSSDYSYYSSNTYSGYIDTKYKLSFFSLDIGLTF